MTRTGFRYYVNWRIESRPGFTESDSQPYQGRQGRNEIKGLVDGQC